MKRTDQGMDWRGILFFSGLLGAQLLGILPFFSPSTRQWVWLVGTLLVLAWNYLYSLKSNRLSKPTSIQISLDWKWWLGIGVLAVFLRSLRFSTSQFWPNFDEDEIAQSAIQLSRYWEWDPFHTIGQIPALYNWIEGSLFRVSHQFFINLYLFPVMVSTATVAMGYLAARYFFSRTTAILATLFLALGYWPCFTGNFSVQAVLLPFWECAAFALLGAFFKSRPPLRSYWAAGLGLFLGLGFWTYLAWPVVALAIGIAVLFPTGAKGSSSQGRDKLIFGTAFILGSIPFAVAAFQEDYFKHLWGFSVFSHWFSLRQRMLTAVDYLNGLFWGFGSDKTLYVPVGGGLLNPLMASFFIAGLAGLWNKTTSRFNRWMVLSFVLFLMPGVLSQNLQVLRIDQLFPLVFVVAAWGLERFLGFFTRERTRTTALVLVLLMGFLGDGARLIHGFKEDEARGQVLRGAYRAFHQMASDAGPGYLWLEFGSGPVDDNPEIQSLEAASSHFNAAEDPKGEHPPIRWAAVVTNLHFQPFLQERFPSFRWGRLVEKEPRWDGGVVVGVMSLEPSSTMDPQVFQNWTRANEWFRRISLEMNDIYNQRTREKALRDFLNPDPSILEDRFLTACYWERLSDFYYLYGFEKNYDLVTQNLEKAVEKGYPAAHLYYKLGSLFLRKHRYSEAKEAFQKALVSPGNQTPARQALDLLSRLESKETEKGS